MHKTDYGCYFVFQEMTEANFHSEFTYLKLNSRTQSCERFKFKVNFDDDVKILQNQDKVMGKI